MPNLTNISVVAEEVGLSKSNLLKLLKKLNYKTIKQRTLESGNQLCCFLDADTYSKVLEYRSEFTKGIQHKSIVYIVRPDKEKRPDRIKVGFSKDFDGRLKTYKTICPDIEVLRIYELDKEMEMAFLNVATKNGKRVGVEVFDIQVEDFLSKCDSLYDVLS